MKPLIFQTRNSRQAHSPLDGNGAPAIGELVQSVGGVELGGQLDGETASLSEAATQALEEGVVDWDGEVLHAVAVAVPAHDRDGGSRIGEKEGCGNVNGDEGVAPVVLHKVESPK